MQKTREDDILIAGFVMLHNPIRAGKTAGASCRGEKIVMEMEQR
jgi:hypothetical protein